MKPEYSQRPGIASVDVCKELLPTGVAKMWTEILRFRFDEGLSLNGLNFVDLGSGIGGVVLATLVLQAGAVVSACGVERDASLHDNMIQWLRSAASRWPWIQHSTQLLEATMINADLTKDGGVVDMLRKADVVFINNYLFESPNGQQPGISLNDKLKIMLCQHLRPDATLVTTCSLHGRAGRITRPTPSLKRTHDHEQCHHDHEHARVIVTHRTFKFAQTDVSWCGTLSAHIATIP
jgi:hypothetical protein